LRILIHGINFAPELTGIGKYTGEMAAFLATLGHAVRVVTAAPYYPNWKVAAGYRAWAYRRETRQDMTIYRCPLWVPAQPTGISRLLHLASFTLSSLPALAGQIAWRPQVVITVAPALLAAPAAWLAGKLAGARTWLHIQDFELDAAVRLGMLPTLGSLIRPMVDRSESLFYRGFDRISTISQRMLQALWRKGIPRQKTVYFPNWVDTQAIYPLPAGGEKLPAVADPLGVPLTVKASAPMMGGCCTIILYSGNMGQKQGLEVVVEAARLLVGQPELQFVLCGEGSARPRVERQAAGLENVHFISLQPPE
jgi:colanic acid biosynthesis glycosyl transferase WcaI